MNISYVLGIASVIIGMATYIPYFRDIFKNKTKPHAFSWFIWGTFQLVTFFAQILNGAGAGSWAVGATAFLCLGVFFISLNRGERHITKFDWFCLAFGLVGVASWIVTNNPLGAVIIAVITDLLGFLPTFRKSFLKPWEETLVTYFGSFVAFSLAYLALDQVNIITALNLVYLIIANGAFVVYALILRQIRPSPHKRKPYKAL